MISSASWTSTVCADWLSALPGTDSSRRGRRESLQPVSDHKKVRVEYYTDDYAHWERENLGEVKIALDGIPRSEPTPASA